MSWGQKTQVFLKLNYRKIIDNKKDILELFMVPNTFGIVFSMIRRNNVKL